MAETVVSASRPAPADRELPPLALEFVEVAGMRVRLGHRLPQGRPYGTVVVLPGRAEFIEKYGETLGELTAEGFAVAILDWRGQGGSDRFIDQRYRGHVVQVDDYLADLTAVLERLQKLSLPRPYLILAHSMGGHIALRHLHDHPDSFAGAVLTAPMFGIQLRPTPEPVARALCRAAVALGAATRYAPGQRDFDLTRFVFATNKLTLGGVTFGWLGAALRSLAAVRRPGYLEAIETPILVCQAGIERIVSNRAQEEVVRRLPHGRLLRFPEAKHELLLERPEIRQQVMRAFFDFAGEFTL
jgi:lysophospholipase